MLEPLPVRTAVARDVNAAARAAAEHCPRLHHDLPRSREEHVRILRVHRESGAARVGVDEQHAVPRLTAVRRAIDAALLLRAGRPAQRADECDIGIGGMRDDAADASGFDEPDIFPRRTGVHGFVDTVTGDVAGANRPGLARPGPHDAGIRARHCERADGLRRLLVEDGDPGLPAVRALPDPARCGARVVGAGIAGNARRGGDPPGRGRAHELKLQRLDPLTLFGTAASASALRGGVTADQQDDEGRKCDAQAAVNVRHGWTGFSW